MTDCELLELAAKAAGISWKPAETDAGKMCELKFGLWLNIVQEPTESTRRRFNPLNDDGDALRLAADLRLDVLWAEHSQSVVALPTPARKKRRPLARPYPCYYTSLFILGEAHLECEGIRGVARSISAQRFIFSLTLSKYGTEGCGVSPEGIVGSLGNTGSG